MCVKTICALLLFFSSTRVTNTKETNPSTFHVSQTNINKFSNPNLNPRWTDVVNPTKINFTSLSQKQLRGDGLTRFLGEKNQNKLISQKLQHTTETFIQKRRRDVPTSSYNKIEDADVGFKLFEELQPPASSREGVEKQSQTNKVYFEKSTLYSDGSFAHSFQTEGGIYSEVSGYQKTLASGAQGQAMRGLYSYTAPDGSKVQVRWVADENGFHAENPAQPLFRMRPRSQSGKNA